MKRIFVNLKRFEVPQKLNGICPSNNPQSWIESVIEDTIDLKLGALDDIQVIYLLPEALLLPAINKMKRNPAESWKNLLIGCQGVFREDVTPGGNFGAFTTNLPATAAINIGCSWSIIGHSEERKDKLGIIETYAPESKKEPKARAQAAEAVNFLINQQVICAMNAGMNVLLCVGETDDERGKGEFTEQKKRIEMALYSQLVNSLQGIKERFNESKIIIGYEPVWAIGPGKTPPGKEYIAFVSKLIKEIVQEEIRFTPEVVYGGGLKEENAGMIGQITTIDGGLVALTQFTGEIGFTPQGLKRIISKYQITRS